MTLLNTCKRALCCVQFVGVKNFSYASYVFFIHRKRKLYSENRYPFRTCKTMNVEHKIGHAEVHCSTYAFQLRKIQSKAVVCKLFLSMAHLDTWKKFLSLEICDKHMWR